MFKLNEDAPTQHVAILVIAAVAIFMSTLDSIKNALHDDTSPQPMKQEVNESGTLMRFKNPEMTWYEKIFCRGYQRSDFCTYRLIHPFASIADESDVKVKEGPAEKTGVIGYRGRLPAPGMSGKSVIDEGTWKSSDDYFRNMNDPSFWQDEDYR